MKNARQGSNSGHRATSRKSGSKQSSKGLRGWWCVAALTTLLLAVSGVHAADNPWQLKRDREGIKVYTRTVPGSRYRAVKATTTISSSLSATVALVRDTAACAEWEALCKRARGLKRVSPTEVYVYQVNNLPWPIADRDVVAHVRWHQDEKSLVVTMTASAVSGMVPRRDHMVRVTDAVTEVTTEAHADPGGPLPAWMVNMVLLNSPYRTLTNMRRILATGRYDEARIDFIEEPKE
jgi:hypothetical protein